MAFEFAQLSDRSALARSKQVAQVHKASIWPLQSHLSDRLHHGLGGWCKLMNTQAPQGWYRVLLSIKGP